MTVLAGLLDTSVLIAAESGRQIVESLVPEQTAVSVITLAELHAGVYAATSTEARARRIATLDSISSLRVFPIDDAAAREWARMRSRLAEAGRRINVNDLWIASVALANDLAVVTQDKDYEVLEGLGGPEVIFV